MKGTENMASFKRIKRMVAKERKAVSIKRQRDRDITIQTCRVKTKMIKLKITRLGKERKAKNGRNLRKYS